MDGIRQIVEEAKKNRATPEVAGRYMSVLKAKMRGLLTQGELQTVCDEVGCAYLGEGLYRADRPVPPWTVGGSAGLRYSHEYARDNNEADGVQIERLEAYKKAKGEGELEEKLSEWVEFILEGVILPGVSEALRILGEDVEEQVLEDDVPF